MIFCLSEQGCIQRTLALRYSGIASNLFDQGEFSILNLVEIVFVAIKILARWVVWFGSVCVVSVVVQSIVKMLKGVSVFLMYYCIWHFLHSIR